MVSQLQVDPTSLVLLLSSFWHPQCSTRSRQAFRYRSVSFSARSGQRRACSKDCFGQQCFPECKKLVACVRTMFLRAQATSSSTAAASSGDGLPDAERLRADAALRGSDWLHDGGKASLRWSRPRRFAEGPHVWPAAPRASCLLSWSNLCVLLPAQRHGFPKHLFLVNSVRTNRGLLERMFLSTVFP